MLLTSVAVAKPEVEEEALSRTAAPSFRRLDSTGPCATLFPQASHSVGGSSPENAGRNPTGCDYGPILEPGPFMPLSDA
ncbi:hypothetical protein QFZ40_001983 [Arthrobacter pascens]|uniref:hypothetical protein n=1 Tax=Arthrobacter pascens TaxID=1677 RepID=UPI002787ABDB|nr:hypothetical protein [Arthrobacter pascens]MDQ0634074.1 hypothetical protein [Arthrobacter pascens]